MSHPDVSISPATLIIEEALHSRQGTVTVVHINSHDPIKGYFQIGNDKADAAAKGLWTIQDARQLHESLHIGAKALAKQCNIPMSDTKHIVATCLYCQKSPLWSSGVNPRGLKASEIWQTDFTLCQLLKPRAWLAITVDTFSGVIIATQHAKANSKATVQHWLSAMAWFGIPKQIKTDNGTNFISKTTREFATKWNIVLKQGIPYNSTGRAIVERANQTLKSKLETLARAEGFTGVIPPSEQLRLLATAMLALNQFPRGDQNQASSQKHWASEAVNEGPPVSVKNEIGEWETGWKLIVIGRGYAAVKKDDVIKWCPLKSLKPVLPSKS
ncbi:Gag-Pro-Pol polyprotein [Turdus rufiventris]|nr:Gag-Pro-Pol polyprotein [Turdus rufiventris]